eukprot:9583057-Alexandrium_andersonii.AAC.1
MGGNVSWGFLRLPGGLPPPRPPAASPEGDHPPGHPQKAPPAPCAGGAFWGVRGGGSPPGDATG